MRPYLPPSPLEWGEGRGFAAGKVSSAEPLIAGKKNVYDTLYGIRLSMTSPPGGCNPSEQSAVEFASQRRYVVLLLLFDLLLSCAGALPSGSSYPVAVHRVGLTCNS